MFVAPDPNIKVFGPRNDNYGRDRLDDIRLYNIYKSLVRKEDRRKKIEKIFNVEKGSQ